MTSSSKNTSPILEIPYQAPKFTSVTQDGKNIDHSVFQNKWTILYFYPKDMTSGCTLEAQEFEQHKEEFQILNCQIIGVSKDSCERHLKFIAKEKLTFTLISDTNSQVCEIFDVWKEKSLYGRKFMGIERTTFIINPKREIVAIFKKVKANGHATNVLNTLKNLK